MERSFHARYPCRVCSKIVERVEQSAHSPIEVGDRLASVVTADLGIWVEDGDADGRHVFGSLRRQLGAKFCGDPVDLRDLGSECLAVVGAYRRSCGHWMVTAVCCDQLQYVAEYSCANSPPVWRSNRSSDRNTQMTTLSPTPDDSLARISQIGTDFAARRSMIIY